MSLSVIGLSVDCADAAALAQFRTQALARPVAANPTAKSAVVDEFDLVAG